MTGLIDTTEPNSTLVNTLASGAAWYWYFFGYVYESPARLVGAEVHNC